jgi:hypothetical protein
VVVVSVVVVLVVDEPRKMYRIRTGVIDGGPDAIVPLS